MEHRDWRIDPQIMRNRPTRRPGVLTAVPSAPPERPDGPGWPARLWAFLNLFDRYPIAYRRLIIATTILLIGTLDFLTGYEASLASLYVIPVFLAAWSEGLAVGLVTALGASTTLIITNWFAGMPYSALWIVAWNIVVRGGTFAALALLASSLRGQLERTNQMSLTDPLTNTWNRRAFYQTFAVELARVARNPSPISLAFIDVDDFKAVNDRLGHQTGDEVLQALASACVRSLRLQDTVARLGGDEFAILMPETDALACEAILHRLEGDIRAVAQGIAPVTLSIGAVTFQETPASVNSALRFADDMMYQAKAAGKNQIAHVRFPLSLDR